MPAAMTTNLTRHRRRVHPDLGRDRRQRLTGTQPGIDIDAVLERQTTVAPQQHVPTDHPTSSTHQIPDSASSMVRRCASVGPQRLDVRVLLGGEKV